MREAPIPPPRTPLSHVARQKGVAQHKGVGQPPRVGRKPGPRRHIGSIIRALSFNSASRAGGGSLESETSTGVRPEAPLEPGAMERGEGWEPGKMVFSARNVSHSRLKLPSGTPGFPVPLFKTINKTVNPWIIRVLSVGQKPRIGEQSAPSNARRTRRGGGYE